MNVGERCSIMFGGVGDARHLYATIISAARHERREHGSARRYHFTVNDIQPPNLLIFQLLEDLANSDVPAEEYLTLGVLFYVFCAPIMPDMVHDHLQKVIIKLLEGLDHDAMLFGYVYVSDYNRKEIRDCILPWQTRGQLYSAATIAQEVIKYEKAVVRWPFLAMNQAKSPNFGGMRRRYLRQLLCCPLHQL